jgi:TP901 family phage tail tape measure protein
MSDRKLNLSVIFEAVDKATSKITGIRKSATEVGKELSKARKELKDLNDTQSNVTSFIKLKKQMVENNAKLVEAQAKVKKLATEMRQAEKPTREMERALARAKKEAGDLAGRVDRDSQSLQRMRDRLKEAGVHTKKLADAQKDLKGKIAEATGRVDQQKEAYAGIMASGGKGGKGGPGSFTDKTVKAGLILGTIKEAADIVSAPIMSDARAQEQMTQIGIKANLSREKLAAMRGEIQRLAPQVRMLPEQLRGGVDFLAASGVNPEQALRMMEPLGKAAHANFADINDLAKAANSALSNLKIPLGKDDIDRTKETARVLDMMSVAGKEGNFEFADMARSFPTLTARLSALGMSGADDVGMLSAALQVAWTATGNADEAANNIDNLLMKINAKETTANFAKFGIDLPKAMKKAYADGKGPLEAIAQLTQQATRGDMTKLSLLFGDAQAQTGVQSLIQNMKEYERIRDKTLGAGAAGEVNRDFARRAEDTSSRWDKLMARWDVFKEGVGNALSGVSNAGLGIIDAMFAEKTMGLIPVKTQQVATATSTGIAAGMAQRRNELALNQYWLTQQDAAAAQQRSVVIGNQVGDGLAIGMEQKAGRVSAAAQSLAAAAQGQVRKDLKIKSPSRVFMELGGFISSGLAEGIHRKGRGPALAASRMAAGVAKAGAVSLTPMASGRGGVAQGGAMGGAGNITIQVYGAPGQSVEELANVVMRKLERAQGVQGRRTYEGDR